MNAQQVSEFTVAIHPEPDHYWAEVVELPGCFATGIDLEELRESLEEAISLYLFDVEKAGTLSSLSASEQDDSVDFKAQVSMALA